MEVGNDGVVRGARVQVGQIFQVWCYYLQPQASIDVFLKNFLQDFFCNNMNIHVIFVGFTKDSKQDISHPNVNVARLEAKKKNLVESSGATDWLA